MSVYTVVETASTMTGASSAVDLLISATHLARKQSAATFGCLWASEMITVLSSTRRIQVVIVLKYSNWISTMSFFRFHVVRNSGSFFQLLVRFRYFQQTFLERFHADWKRWFFWVNLEKIMIIWMATRSWSVFCPYCAFSLGWFL